MNLILVLEPEQNRRDHKLTQINALVCKFGDSRGKMLNNYSERNYYSLLSLIRSLNDVSLAVDSMRLLYRAEFFESLAKEASKKYAINWRILYAIWMNESQLEISAKGDGKYTTAGIFIPGSWRSFGLGQIQLLTAHHHYSDTLTIRDLLDPEINAFVSAKILRDYLNLYDNNYVYAIAAYNQGPVKTKEQFTIKIPPRNSKYVFRVLSIASDIPYSDAIKF
jgi:soluble lytic murein transglycosylase-like protein